MRCALALIPLLAAPLPLAAQLSPEARQPARLSRYAESGATLSFVASAVSALDDCAAALEFRERRVDAVRILEILCQEGGETRFVRLTFVRVSDGRGRIRLRPFRMEFLP